MYRVLALGLVVAACRGNAADPIDAPLGSGPLRLHVTGDTAFDSLVLLQSVTGTMSVGPATPAMQARGEVPGTVAYQWIMAEDDRSFTPPATEAFVQQAAQFVTLVLAVRDGTLVGLSEIDEFSAPISMETLEVVLAAPPANTELWGPIGHCVRIAPDVRTPRVWVPQVDLDCDGIESNLDCLPLTYCDLAHPTDDACARATCAVSCEIDGDACDIGTAYVCRDDAVTPQIMDCAAYAGCEQEMCRPRAFCSGTGAVACQVPVDGGGALCPSAATMTIELPHATCSEPAVTVADNPAAYLVAFEPSSCRLQLTVAAAAAFGEIRVDYATEAGHEAAMIDLAATADPACDQQATCTAPTGDATCDYQ